MRQYEIFTDATCDLPQEVINDMGINVIPMDFEMDGKVYSHFPDERQLNIKTFYELSQKGIMSTILGLLSLITLGTAVYF